LPAQRSKGRITCCLSDISVFFSSRRRHTRSKRDWSSDVCSSDLGGYKVTVDYATRLSATGIFFHSAPWSVVDQGVRNVSHGCIKIGRASCREREKSQARVE